MHNTDAGPCTAIAVGARNSRSQNALAACEINVALADTGLTPVTGTEPGNCVTVPVMTAVPALSVLKLGSFAEALLARSEEHTSELQSLMRISYAVFCLKKTHYRRYDRA